MWGFDSSVPSHRNNGRPRPARTPSPATTGTPPSVSRDPGQKARLLSPAGLFLRAPGAHIDGNIFEARPGRAGAEERCLGTAPPGPPSTSDPHGFAVAPNLADYETARREFTWEGARAGLEASSGGSLNITAVAIDRHVAAGRGEKTAIRWRGRRGERAEISYAELQRRTARFATVLERLGVGRGDVVFALADRVPDLYVAALGTLRHGSVFSPLFPAFGPEPVQQRMAIGKGKVLVTTPNYYRRKVAPIRDQLPGLLHVLLIGQPGEEVPGRHVPRPVDGRRHCCGHQPGDRPG